MYASHVGNVGSSYGASGYEVSGCHKKDSTDSTVLGHFPQRQRIVDDGDSNPTAGEEQGTYTRCPEGGRPGGNAETAYWTAGETFGGR